jgi:hypothetical protein
MRQECDPGHERLGERKAFDRIRIMPVEQIAANTEFTSMRRHLVLAVALVATSLPRAMAESCGGSSWVFRASYYTHDASTGTRVNQFAKEAPAYVRTDPTYQESVYRHSQSAIRVGESFDYTHTVETWGGGENIRPYGEWLYPYRAGATPFGPWGNPQGPWTTPFGSWVNPYGLGRLPYSPYAPGQLPPPNAAPMPQPPAPLPGPPVPSPPPMSQGEPMPPSG